MTSRDTLPAVPVVGVADYYPDARLVSRDHLRWGGSLLRVLVALVAKIVSSYLGS